jgi:uncharacterized protein
MEAIEAKARELLLQGASSGHDYAHVQRVHALCCRLAEMESAPVLRPVLEAAALLHDIGREWERRDPSIDHAQKSAELAEPILKEAGFPEECIPKVLQAIRTHRFSSKIAPETLEAMLLQDADRIEASGALGIAMTFAYGGAHDRILYHPEDPFAEGRNLDDKTYSLDHFYTKILALPDSLHTESARAIARERTAFTRAYLEQLRREMAGEG